MIPTFLPARLPGRRAQPASGRRSVGRSPQVRVGRRPAVCASRVNPPLRSVRGASSTPPYQREKHAAHGHHDNHDDQPPGQPRVSRLRRLDEADGASLWIERTVVRLDRTRRLDVRRRERRDLSDVGRQRTEAIDRCRPATISIGVGGEAFPTAGVDFSQGDRNRQSDSKGVCAALRSHRRSVHDNDLARRDTLQRLVNTNSVADVPNEADVDRSRRISQGRIERQRRNDLTHERDIDEAHGVSVGPCLLA